jgi:hypothetical protein
MVSGRLLGVFAAIELPSVSFWKSEKGCEVCICDITMFDHSANILVNKFTIEWLKMKDVVAGELKTDNYPRIDLPSIPQDQVEAFSKMAIVGILKAYHRGVYDVSNEWNQLLPDLKFTKADELLDQVWGRNTASQV